MSYSPDFFFKGHSNHFPVVEHNGDRGYWCTNGQRFATAVEAVASGRNRLMSWFVPRDCRAGESTDPVNYRWDPVVGDVRLDTDVKLVGAPDTVHYGEGRCTDAPGWDDVEDRQG